MKVVLNIRDNFSSDILKDLGIDKWDEQFERCDPKLIKAVEKYCDLSECEFGIGSKVQIVEVPSDGKYYISLGEFNEEYLRKVEEW